MSSRFIIGGFVPQTKQEDSVGLIHIHGIISEIINRKVTDTKVEVICEKHIADKAKIGTACLVNGVGIQTEDESITVRASRIVSEEEFMEEV